MRRNRQIRRREAIKALSGLVAMPYVITGTALGGADKAPANERVTLGHIGVGARGLSQAKWFGPESQSVAVCDPFRSRRARIASAASAPLREIYLAAAEGRLRSLARP